MIDKLGSKKGTNSEVMIKGLRKLADWLEKVNCKLHLWWNNILERLKAKCQCERLQKL